MWKRFHNHRHCGQALVFLVCLFHHVSGESTASRGMPANVSQAVLDGQVCEKERICSNKPVSIMNPNACHLMQFGACAERLGVIAAPKITAARTISCQFLSARPTAAFKGTKRASCFWGVLVIFFGALAFTSIGPDA